MRSWFRNRSERLLDKELRAHFEEQVAEYVTTGMTLSEANRRVRLEFGHLDEVKEECRDVRPFAWLDGLRRDAHFALRLFARAPGFTAVCLVTLALGIGANAAVFSLINALVLTPPPYPEPDTVIAIEEDSEHLRNNPRKLFAMPYMPFYSERTRFQTVSDIAVAQFATLELHEDGDPESLTAAWASGNFLDVLDIQPLLGRWFTSAETRERAPVVVLSHRLWLRRFGEDPNIIGRSVRLSRGQAQLVVHQIIGVLPQAVSRTFPFKFRNLDFDAFTPPFGQASLDNNSNSPTLTFGRLSAGSSLEAATTELIARQATLFPDKNHTNGGRRIVVRTAADQATWSFRTGLWVLVSAVGCILLIACANLAGLLLTRSSERKHEMAIRSGLGADRRTILSQTLTETTILTTGGGVLAVFVAWLGIRGLQAISFSTLPNMSEPGIDWNVVTYCFILSMLTAALIGALPAWNASRTDALSTLRQTAATEPSGERRMRDALVVTQIALSLILIVGAGLLVHSMRLLHSLDPGYDAVDVISLSVRSRGRGEEPVLAFWREVLESVQSLPGVQGVASVDYVPPVRVTVWERYEVIGEPPPPPDAELRTNTRSVSQDYFSVLGIQLLEGHGFSQTVQAEGREAVVSRAFANLHWPTSSAVGRSFRLMRREPIDVEIVGVVEDVRQKALRDAPEPIIYRQTLRANALLVKTSGDPTSMVDAIKHAVREIDPTQTFQTIQTLEAREAVQNAELRFYMYLLSSFAGLGLVLAVVGLYSVAAQAVVRRTREIGLRMALGASRWQILIMIARQGLILAVAGITVGLAGAYSLSKVLESWLYEIAPTDPVTFGAAAVMLASVALFATLIPAHRATRLEPMKALRYD